MSLMDIIVILASLVRGLPYDVRSSWGGSPKSRRKEQNQLFCDSDRGGKKKRKFCGRHIWKPPSLLKRNGPLIIPPNFQSSSNESAMSGGAKAARNGSATASSSSSSSWGVAATADTIMGYNASGA